MAKTITLADLKCTDCPFWQGGRCRFAARSQLRDRRLPGDATFLYQGDLPRAVGVLRKGYMRLVRHNDDGRRIGLGIARPGDVIGGLFGRPVDHMIEAITPVHLCQTDITTFEHGMRADPSMRAQIMRNMTEQLSRVRELIWRRGLLSSRERVVDFLVSAARIMPSERQPDGSVTVEICLPRRDWADLADTTVETVSRTMTWLAARGEVRALKRSRYRIADPRRLARLARLDDGRTRCCPAPRPTIACHQ